MVPLVCQFRELSDGLQASTLVCRRLVNGLITNSVEERAYTEDRDKALIPLVVSEQGVPLRMLRDCPEWLKQIRKKNKDRLPLSLLTSDNDNDEEDDDRSLNSVLASRWKGQIARKQKTGKSARNAIPLSSDNESESPRRVSALVTQAKRIKSSHRHHKQTDVSATTKDKRQHERVVTDDSDGDRRGRMVERGRKDIRGCTEKRILDERVKDKVKHGRLPSPSRGHTSRQSARPAK
jgi:hypothetical protein